MNPRPVVRLRRALLRWDRLIAAASLVLPLVVPFLVGFLWLAEHGFLLPYIGICAGIAALGFGGRWFARRRRPRSAEEHSVLMDEMSVAADPEWTSAERRVYDKARRRIERDTAEPIAWTELPDLARQVIDDIARGLGKDDRKALDFTLPEALLLTERAASRYRDHLRRHVPFSDQISLQRLHWLWRHRDRAQMAVDMAFAGHRILRFALNPAKGALREVEWLMAEGNTSFLGNQMMGVLQAVLLEEVAHAAVELYSGRLRFSDAELLELQLEESRGDRARMAAADAPLRVLVVGQTSSGKSTLINALLGAEMAETDMRSTTGGTAGYETEIDGTAALLLDTRGIDGDDAARKALLQEMTAADVILWTLRANRPGRAADKALLDDFAAWFEAHPDRRRPPVIAVATAVDRLAPDWPYPEHALPKPLRGKIEAAMRAIADDIGIGPRPVSAVAPDWNIASLERALAAAVSEGLLVQRNRLRVGAAERSGGHVSELSRSGSALWQGARIFGSRLATRMLGGAGDTPKRATKAGEQNDGNPETGEPTAEGPKKDDGAD